MEELPVGWVKIEIGDVASVIAGGTPKASDKTNFEEPPHGIAWLTPADLSGYKHKYISNGKRDLSQKGLKSSSAKLMPIGSILFSSRAPIGYVAIAKNKIATNQGFKNFVFTNEVNSSYAYYYLKSIKYLAESKGTGTTFKELSGAAAKKLPFILAPLNEQIRIANKLDTLLAKVEAAQTRLEKIPTLLKRFRQSVLAAATSGELTAEWRIKENFIKNETWEKTTLGETTNYGKTTKIEPKDMHKNTWVLELEDIEKDSSRILQKLNFSERKSKSTKNIFRKGDVLYGKLRPYLNKVIIANGDGACTTEILPLEGRNGLTNKFLFYFLLSPQFFDYVETISHGLNMPRLGTKAGKEAKIFVPSKQEQKEIVHRVEALFALADSVEKQYQQAFSRLKPLLQSILAKGFQGKLVPQDPNDEPAEQLLARIQAQREKQKPAKKTPKSKKTR